MFPSIIQTLNLAHEKGLLKGKSKILKFVADITRNITQKTPRYGKFTTQIYGALRTIGVDLLCNTFSVL